MPPRLLPLYFVSVSLVFVQAARPCLCRKIPPATPDLLPQVAPVQSPGKTATSAVHKYRDQCRAASLIGEGILLLCGHGATLKEAKKAKDVRAGRGPGCHCERIVLPLLNPVVPLWHWLSLASPPLPRPLPAAVKTRTLATPQAGGVGEIFKLTKDVVTDGMRGLLRAIELPEDLSAKQLYQKFIVQRNAVPATTEEARVIRNTLTDLFFLPVLFCRPAGPTERDVKRVLLSEMWLLYPSRAS
jgi:hypothetical protein